jgi:HPt (histidine-containing phosphotransfer) domain-containing protein
MATIAPDDEIFAVWKTLSHNQKQSVIQLIHSFKESELNMSAEEIVDYNKEIEEAEQRILNGEFTTHESVVQSLDKWK